MPWSRMRFRDGLVWVKVDEAGTITLDARGRAEMRYRPDDARTYHPHASNLSPAPVEDGSHAGTERRSTATHLGPRIATSSTRPRPSTRASAASRLNEPTPIERRISVWTDGACAGNPGPMGIGIVIVSGDRRIEHGEYLGHGTNNIAELIAIQRGLQLVEHHFPDLVTDAGTEIRIYSDSGYGIGVLAQGWKAKANQALVFELRSYLGRFARLRFEKVPGHAGIPENDRCDELARQAIRQTE